MLHGKLNRILEKVKNNYMLHDNKTDYTLWSAAKTYSAGENLIQDRGNIRLFTSKETKEKLKETLTRRKARRLT